MKSKPLKSGRRNRATSSGYRPNELTIIEESTARVLSLNENVSGVPMIPNAAAMGYRVQSFLMEDEWQMIDREVIAASEYPLRGERYRAAGLVVPVGPDVLSSTWYTQGDMTGATTNMLGRSMGNATFRKSVRGRRSP